MLRRLTIEKQRALKAAIEDSNKNNAWVIGLDFKLVFAAANLLKGGSNVRLQLQLLRVYLPGYLVTFAGSANGFSYAFVLGYLSGTMVIALYHAERGL